MAERRIDVGIAQQSNLDTSSLRRVVEYSPIANLMIDCSGQIVLVNSEMERIFGYPRIELIGNSVDLLVPRHLSKQHGVDRQSFFAAPQRRLMGSGRELFGRRKDGSEFPVEIGLTPINTEQGMLVLAAIVDITERRRAQQKIEDALQEKTVLLNEIHHRVKNNLQVIASLLNLQAASAADERLREALNESLQRVRAMTLTHQLLYERKNFSFIDLGEYLGRLTQQLLGAYRGMGSNVKLILVQPDEKIHLDMDRSIPCGLVVNELVTNAFKHAFPGNRDGEIRVVLDVSAPGVIELSVHDDGIGLPPDFALAKARSLGLQLVPMLIDQLQGKLAIGPPPGTHFAVSFARTTAQDSLR